MPEQPGGELVQPCRCKGNRAHIHKSCLAQVQRRSSEPSSCGYCGGRFNPDCSQEEYPPLVIQQGRPSPHANQPAGSGGWWKMAGAAAVVVVGAGLLVKAAQASPQRVGLAVAAAAIQGALQRRQGQAAQEAGSDPAVAASTHQPDPTLVPRANMHAAQHLRQRQAAGGEQTEAAMRHERERRGQPNRRGISPDQFVL